MLDSESQVNATQPIVSLTLARIIVSSFINSNDSIYKLLTLYFDSQKVVDGDAQTTFCLVWIFRISKRFRIIVWTDPALISNSWGVEELDISAGSRAISSHVIILSESKKNFYIVCVKRVVSKGTARFLSCVEYFYCAFLTANFNFDETAQILRRKCGHETFCDVTWRNVLMTSYNVTSSNLVIQPLKYVFINREKLVEFRMIF